MPERIQVRASIVSSAQPDEIYALLVNSATYPLWSMIRYYESLREGRDALRHMPSAFFRWPPLQLRPAKVL
jgi:hypothetical protein